MARVGLRCFILAGVLGALSSAPAQAQDIFTATAVQGDSDQADFRTIPVTFIVEKFLTDADQAVAVAALKESAQALHDLLALSPDIGRIIVGDRIVPLKYIYRRGGRVTLLANEPLVFLDPGADSNKSKSGFEFALAVLDVSLPGFGAGRIEPAVKLGINANGQIESREYGATVVRLNDLRKQ